MGGVLENPAPCGSGRGWGGGWGVGRGRGGGDLCVQEGGCTAGLGVTTPLPTSAPHLLYEALPHQSHGKQSPLHALAV